MVRLLAVALASVCVFADDPTGQAATRGELISRGDFQINIHPPQEDDQDVIDSLDLLARVEESIRRAEEEDFALEKEKLIKVLQSRIDSVVTTAFEPIQALIPNPIHTQVRRALARYTFPQRDESKKTIQSAFDLRGSKNVDEEFVHPVFLNVFIEYRSELPDPNRRPQV